MLCNSDDWTKSLLEVVRQKVEGLLNITTDSYAEPMRDMYLFDTDLRKPIIVERIHFCML